LFVSDMLLPFRLELIKETLLNALRSRC
jgi:hypothetical protein